MSIHRFLPAANQAAQIIWTVFDQRPDTNPHHIRSWMLVEHEGRVWLFVVLDERRLPSMRTYMSSELTHHLSSALKNRPVLVSNHTGLRLGVLLSDLPNLPDRLPAPDYRRGLLQLGVDGRNQPVTTDWENLGHALVAGMTRSGKSNLLRLLVSQAIAEGMHLLLVDPDGRSFPALNGHSALIAPIAIGPDAAQGVLESALAEVTRRSGLYAQAGAGIDTLERYNTVSGIEPLPRVLVVVDEFNGLAAATGGVRGGLAQAATRLAWGSLKFGIHLVLAGQDFTKDIVGPVREQMGTRLCFRVATPVTSRIVLGRYGAERIRTPGRALTNSWGLIQAYEAPALAMPTGGDGLTTDERRLVDSLRQEWGGRVTYAALLALGLNRPQADRLRHDWLQRGLARPGGEKNALILADWLANERTQRTVQTDKQE